MTLHLSVSKIYRIAEISYLHVVTTALSVSCALHFRELQRKEKSIIVTGCLQGIEKWWGGGN